MDRVFLIAGASSGIGAATARQAAEAGYKLVLGARSADKLQELAAELGGIAVPCDVTDYAQVEAMVERARTEFGRIDVVLANAGVGHPRGFESGDVEAAKQMVLINVFGIYATIRATAAALRATKGHLVITGSVAGRRALQGSLYSATKFAVNGMAEAARLDFNGTGVRTTLISPGMVETPGFSHSIEDTLKAEDIARAVLFAVTQPPHMDVNEILVRPTAQDS
ncbi:SDR family oxidoreductase [Solirubrobacter soli]|uniref:SDR family oxidoreductase n=1 Tax=Solirubrobacter soli TaxID=363832 RepID=UPI000489DD49|nr:SDR family oxidoreductase [Solirubrobacter soli]